MIADKMKDLVKNNSVIREMFEEGKKLTKIYGKENVYDFSLGNPSVPAPKEINEAIKKIIDSEDSCLIHGYMSNSGFEDVREKITASLNKKFNTDFSKDNIIMTVGAASGINIVLKSILNPEEEVIVFSPYFMEYRNYIKNYDGKIVEVLCNESDFQPNLEEFERKITEKTRAVIINTPNNPTGVVYSEETLKNISDILIKKEKEFNNTIFLISDEPYRELVYDNIEIPYVTKFYNNTFVVYSYSKSLSLPGERIGYVIVPKQMEDSKTIFEAITIANRITGCVNAPSLMQRVIGECVDLKVDISQYKENRDLLYNGLRDLNFECVYPQGAFYLFVKSPIKDDKEFCEIAKKYNILLVPGSSFAYPGYVRISYCVSNKMIKKSFIAFRKVVEEIKNQHKHAIIIIKNDKNEYLQYYDKRWDSYLFLNCKLEENFNEQDIIIREINQKLKIPDNDLQCNYLNDKIHKKYSVSAQKEKEYHHYFYSMDIKEMPSIMKEKNFIISDMKFSWYSLEELENDTRIQEVNSDIVKYVKELEENCN